MLCFFGIDVRVRGLFSMASQSVARGESFAAFIPGFERLIAEAVARGRFRASPLRGKQRPTG
jgi:hypothetical protein